MTDERQLLATDVAPTPGADGAAAPVGAAGAAPGVAAGAAPTAAPTAGDASLLALVDRLASLLERSDLLELEVEAGGTGIVLRKAAALAPMASAAHAIGDGAAAGAADTLAARDGAAPSADAGGHGPPARPRAPHRHLLRLADPRVARRSWRWAGRSSSARSSASSRR